MNRERLTKKVTELAEEAKNADEIEAAVVLFALAGSLCSGRELLFANLAKRFARQVRDSLSAPLN